jgi:hypothetical protein
MNKMIMVLCGIFLALILSGCTTQSGIHQDYVQGWDTGIIWNHAYTVNDHNTCYCFDGYNMPDILNDAMAKNQKVLIHYSKHLFGRGFFCSCAENYEVVVIDSISLEED